MEKIIKRNGWIWKLHIRGNCYYPILPYRPGIRADKDLNVYGGDPITTAIIIGGVVAGVGISEAHQARKQQKSAEEAARDFAADQAEEAKAEATRLEEKFGLTPGELAREQRIFGVPEGEEAIGISEGAEAKRFTEAERRTGLSGEELLREAGPDTRKLLDAVALRFGMTGEELFRAEGSTAQALADQILAETQDPTKFYEDTLTEQLELVRQQVNQEAQRRGVFSGEIRLENLGRAGVELAIKSAQEKTTQRQQALNNAYQLLQTYTGLSEKARGEQATVGQTALTEQEQARAELDTLLANMQQLDLSAKSRASGVAISAATGVREPGIAREADIQAAILGGQVGSAQARQQAGLDLIGQGAGIATTQFPTAKPTTTTDTTGTGTALGQAADETKKLEAKRKLQQRVGATDFFANVG